MAAPTLECIIALGRQKAGLAPEDELTADSALLDGGLWLDSVVMLELLLELEEEFGVELAADELHAVGALETPGKLAQFIDARGEGD